jgi:hypothetical protein
VPACKAKGCVVETPENKLFCSVHWGNVPSAMKQQLADAYGTRKWADQLAATINDLFLMESEDQDPFFDPDDLPDWEPPDCPDLESV